MLVVDVTFSFVVQCYVLQVGCNNGKDNKSKNNTIKKIHLVNKIENIETNI